MAWTGPDTTTDWTAPDTSTDWTAPSTATGWVNPPHTWTAGNFYPDSGGAVESMTVYTTAVMFEVGAQRDTPGTRPGLLERAAATDAIEVTGYNTPTADAAVYDDSSTYHLEAHFTTTAARDAYAAELAATSTPAQAAAVVQNYRDHIVGGYWGTLGVAL